VPLQAPPPPAQAPARRWLILVSSNASSECDVLANARYPAVLEGDRGLGGKAGSLITEEEFARSFWLGLMLKFVYLVLVIMLEQAKVLY